MARSRSDGQLFPAPDKGYSTTRELVVTVRYFAATAEASGRGKEVIGFPVGATLSDLKRVLADRYGTPMSRVLDSGSFLLDRVLRRDPDRLLADRVDVLPPFAGG